MLAMLVLVNTIVLIFMTILMLHTVWGIGSNTTTIESWEKERHSTLVRRARVNGGYLKAPDGTRVKIRRQEYPWDVGIYANIAQAMGSHNPLIWIWPFAPSLPLDRGLHFPDNGFEEAGTSWPPPDPDRMAVHRLPREDGDAFMHSLDPDSFRQRQIADLARRQSMQGLQRRTPFYKRVQPCDGAMPDQDSGDELSYTKIHNTAAEYEGEEAWRNAEGERLGDYGVDEDAEFYDEDNVPLATLIRQRKSVTTTRNDALR